MAVVRGDAAIPRCTVARWRWRCGNVACSATFGTYASHVQPLYGHTGALPGVGGPVRPSPGDSHARRPHRRAGRDRRGRAGRGGQRHGPRSLKRLRRDFSRMSKRPSSLPVALASSACMSFRCCWRRTTTSASSTTWRGATGPGWTNWSPPAQWTWSSRTSVMAARCTTRCGAADHVIHFATCVDQQERGRPVREHRHQHGGQRQCVRRGGRPRCRAVGVRLVRLGVRRPQEAADARG